MTDNQKGHRGQNQNQDMNRSSGSNLVNSSRSGQNQQTQKTGVSQSGYQPGRGKAGNAG